jgi:hypothetical protein
MKKIIPIVIAGLLLCTAFGAVALPNDITKTMIENNAGKADYTHTVLVEVGTATWCSACPASNTAWHNIYGSGTYDFEYTELVYDVNTPANTRFMEFNPKYVPTSYWDGGQYAYPGTDMSTFYAYLDSSGSRIVPNIVADLDVTWLGSAQVGIAYSVVNNEASNYPGHLRIYVLELESTLWEDYNGNPYHHAFLNFAVNQAIDIPAGDTISDTIVWDGAAAGYPGISSENIQVILAVFDDTPYQGYSDPPSGNPFWAYYVDETIAATPQSNSAPYKPNPPSGPTTGAANVEYTYSGNTSDPNGDNIYYLFDWGDGTNSSWLGPYPSGDPVEANHVWAFGGTYDVKLKAKDVSVDGPWSDPLTVQITGSNIELQNVKGGLFRVRAEIKNTGDEPLSDVNWNITLHSGAFLGKKTSGQNLTIPANSSLTIQSGLIFGFGTTSIKIEAYIPDGPSAMILRNGTIFLFIVKVNT